MELYHPAKCMINFVTVPNLLKSCRIRVQFEMRIAAPAILVTVEALEMTATFMISGLLQGCGILHAGNRKQ